MATLIPDLNDPPLQPSLGGTHRADAPVAVVHETIRYAVDLALWTADVTVWLVERARDEWRHGAVIAALLGVGTVGGLICAAVAR